MIAAEMAEGLALVALIRGVRRHPGYGAELVTRCGARSFAEVFRLEPVRHAHVRVIATGGCYVSPFGLTPVADLDVLVTALVGG
ncbi:hypothetical protein ACIBF1_35380 [Spirillospora sp. NPDC050679]